MRCKKCGCTHKKSASFDNKQICFRCRTGYTRYARGKI